MIKERILVVDDEPDLCEILSFNLDNEGYEVAVANSAEEALEMLDAGNRFDLILLDVMMERMSGFDMVRLMRQQGDNTPVIFLTALGSEVNLLEGFGAGADDYVSKPFSFPTVLARIKAVLKRVTASTQGRNATEGIVIDMDRHEALVDGKRLSLTRKEFGILSLLMQHVGEHFTREQIIGQVWENDTYVTERSVDVHIARLRKKLGRYGNKIVNHSGFGYTFISTEK